MPKMKTKKAITKRIKVSARGKILRYPAGASHLKSRKSNKRLRGLRKPRKLSKGFAKQAKGLLGI
jgi:large subunit ribosomal protein L35